MPSAQTSPFNPERTCTASTESRCQRPCPVGPGRAWPTRSSPGRGGDAPDVCERYGIAEAQGARLPARRGEAALDGVIGVRCAERPTTFDGRQRSRIKLMNCLASGPAQPQGGTPSEPVVSRDATKSASRKVNELRGQPTARRRRTPILYVSGGGVDGDWLAPRTSTSVDVLGVVSCRESSAVFSRQHPGDGGGGRLGLPGL